MPRPLLSKQICFISTIQFCWGTKICEQFFRLHLSRYPGCASGKDVTESETVAAGGKELFRRQKQQPILTPTASVQEEAAAI